MGYHDDGADSGDVSAAQHHQWMLSEPTGKPANQPTSQPASQPAN
jgi:hypothetical protein